jgi:predicted SnoaL-like aldol condensation-catalyzing enzyme
VDDWKSYITDHAVAYDFVFKIAGQGNYVVAYSNVLMDGTAYAQFDILRMQNGKNAEHWSNKEPVPARSEPVNSGKF